MNGTETNKSIITIVTATICTCALIGVGTESLCYFLRTPDMNNNLSHAFVHIVDTLIGAMIAMLIQTRAQEKLPAVPTPTPSVIPIPTEIQNPPEKPIPVVPVEPKPEGQP